MKKIISIGTLLLFILSSCGQEIVHIPEKPYKTFQVQDGTLTLTDTIVVPIEGRTTSDLAFKVGGRVSAVYVHPGERVKKGQILAELSNQESSIQFDALGNISQKLENLGSSTNVVKVGTENLMKSTSKLYDKRLDGVDANILSLKNTIEKAKQNLGNQTSALPVTFSTLAHDYDRLVSSMLYEGDKILGITTNFEYSNDGWESYLGIRMGNGKSDATNKWGSLYARRGKIRSYTESGATISDINTAIQDLANAYTDARLYVSSMSSLLQNSAIGGGLSEEKLNTWVSAWLAISTDEQQSEASFMSWKNGALNLTSKENGSGSVADKDIHALELDLQNLQISRETLSLEKQAKLKEIQTSVATVQSQKEQISVQVEQNRMNTALAGVSIEYSILRAPYDGVILQKSINEGNMVNIGSPVMKISSVDKNLVKTFIDNDIYRYKIGDSVNLTHLTTGKSLSGTVTLIQSEKDPLHNKNAIEITLQNTNENIGQRVMIALIRKKIPLQNGVIIPLQSIVTRYGTPGVFCIEDGKAVFGLVKVIGSDLSLAEVIGVTAGSILITEGKENIIDGETLSGRSIVSGEIFSKK